MPPRIRLLLGIALGIAGVYGLTYTFLDSLSNPHVDAGRTVGLVIYSGLIISAVMNIWYPERIGWK